MAQVVEPVGQAELVVSVRTFDRVTGRHAELAETCGTTTPDLLTCTTGSPVQASRVGRWNARGCTGGRLSDKHIASRDARFTAGLPALEGHHGNGSASSLRRSERLPNLTIGAGALLHTRYGRS